MGITSAFGALGGIGNASQGGGTSSGGSWNNNMTDSWSQTYGAAATAASVAAAERANELARQRMKEVMAFNAQEAAKNREWQEKMSNSAFQRATADLKAAGLNPILAAGASASTPGGGMASTNALQAQMAQTFADSESYSQSRGEGESWNKSSYWQEANMAKQVEEAGAAVADAIEYGKDKIGSSAKKVGEWIGDVAQGFGKAAENWEGTSKELGNKILEFIKKPNNAYKARK